MATPQTPPPVRAVARVGAGPGSGGPWRFVRYRPWHRLGPFRVEQLVVVEIVLIAVLALLGRPLWQVVLGAVVGLVLLLVAFLGTGGRWWLERVALRNRYRRRRAAARPGQGPDQRLSVLRELSPSLNVEVAEERGSRVGVGYDGTGWFAVAEVEAGGRDGVIGEDPEALALGTLGRVLLDQEFPASSVQIVTHTVPSPTTVLGVQAPCQLSYRELVNSLPGGPVTHQTQWIAVRLEGEDAIDVAAARGGGREGVHKALISGLSRVVKSARSGSRTCRLLDGDELLDALVRSCGVVGTGADPRRNRTVEQWERWQGDGLAHTGYWVREWPQLRTENTALLADLVSRCGVETSLSVQLSPPSAVAPVDGDPDPTVDLHCVVRVMAEPPSLKAACEAFTGAAGRAGFDLRLLGGEQAPAVYASAPTGSPTPAREPR
jgi:type VII secretion protein EccE